MRSFVLIVFVLFLATPALAASFSGRVVHVADGDTITVLRPGNVEEKIRLAEIDCPESGQAFG